jgi:hypothetical protein
MTTPPDAPKEYRFFVRPAKIGGHYSVWVIKPSGMEQEIFGFETEQKAKDWIADKSAQWIKDSEAKKGDAL